MNIRVQTQGFPLTASISAWTFSRLSRVLKPFSEEVVAVDAFLKEGNGPQGEDDKKASLRIQLRSGAPVVANIANSDLYAAIDQSARTASRTVLRQLERKSSR